MQNFYLREKWETKYYRNHILKYQIKKLKKKKKNHHTFIGMVTRPHGSLTVG
jgi:hypothetical protein